MSSLCWWRNLPSFEINVNTPTDINVNVPIDLAKNSIWLDVPFSLQIGVLQRDVHAVTQSYLLMHKRDQFSSVFFGHIQEFFKSLSIDRQTSMHNRQFTRLLWENNLFRQEWLQGQTFSYRLHFQKLFSGLAHCYFLLQHAKMFLHLRTWSNNHGSPDIRLHTSCFGWERPIV